jgi:mannose-1-phosphate guanylyltransferase/phosphomannomutase
MTLVDDNGRILSDTEGLMAFLAMVLGTGREQGAEASRAAEVELAAPGSTAVGRPGPPAGSSPAAATPPNGPRAGLTVALPVSVPNAAETLCKRAGASLVWTKLSACHLMEVASRPGIDFAAGLEGGYIFPRFLPAYDAVAALAHAFVLLASTGAKLSAVVGAQPQVFSAHEGVVTPWEKKGLVMRSVMDLGNHLPMVLVDGVKILHEDGWCLVVPDPEEALTHVWSEGASQDGALVRAQQYARRIRSLLRG